MRECGIAGCMARYAQRDLDGSRVVRVSMVASNQPRHQSLLHVRVDAERRTNSDGSSQTLLER